MEVGIGVEQNPSTSHDSSLEFVELVSQSPLSVTNQVIQGGEIEIVLPFGEELVEAQHTWNIAKAMGLKVSNELEVIDYLSKIKEHQDFTLPRKRGRNSPTKMVILVWC